MSRGRGRGRAGCTEGVPPQRPVCPASPGQLEGSGGRWCRHWRLISRSLPRWRAGRARPDQPFRGLTSAPGAGTAWPRGLGQPPPSPAWSLSLKRGLVLRSVPRAPDGRGRAAGAGGGGGRGWGRELQPQRLRHPVRAVGPPAAQTHTQLVPKLQKVQVRRRGNRGSACSQDSDGRPRALGCCLHHPATIPPPGSEVWLHANQTCHLPARLPVQLQLLPPTGSPP